jgi:hypothetical protein
MSHALNCHGGVIGEEVLGVQAVVVVEGNGVVTVIIGGSLQGPLMQKDETRRMSKK